MFPSLLGARFWTASTRRASLIHRFRHMDYFFDLMPAQTSRSLSAVARGQAQLQIADPHHVTGMKLPSPTRLALAVHRGRLGREERLDLGAAVDHPCELQQLPEPDRVTVDRHFWH